MSVNHLTSVTSKLSLSAFRRKRQENMDLGNSENNGSSQNHTATIVTASLEKDSKESSSEASQKPLEKAEERLLSPALKDCVYRQVKIVDRAFQALAKLENKRDLYTEMLDGSVPFSGALSLRRERPALPMDYDFSVRAREELETMQSVHDREFVRRLRDDLVTKVIPECKTDCEEIATKARNKLEKDCPGSTGDDLEAKQLLASEIVKKREKRLTMLKNKNQRRKSQNGKRRREDNEEFPKGKRQRVHFRQHNNNNNNRHGIFPNSKRNKGQSRRGQQDRRR